MNQARPRWVLQKTGPPRKQKSTTNYRQNVVVSQKQIMVSPSKCTLDFSRNRASTPSPVFFLRRFKPVKDLGFVLKRFGARTMIIQFLFLWKLVKSGPPPSTGCYQGSPRDYQGSTRVGSSGGAVFELLRRWSDGTTESFDPPTCCFHMLDRRQNPCSVLGFCVSINKLLRGERSNTMHCPEG